MPLSALAGLWLSLEAASAHPPSYSTLYAELLGADLDVVVDVHPPSLIDVRPAIDLDGDDRLVASEVDQRADDIQRDVLAWIQVGTDDGPCAPDPLSAPYLPADERLILRVRYRCPSRPSSLQWHVDLLMEDEGGHTVIGRFRTPAGFSHYVFDAEHRDLDLLAARPRTRRIASDDEPAPDPAPPQGAASLLATFLGDGIEHILGGVDHLAFVLSLAVAAPGWRALAAAVTAFTVGHSASLALTALDVLRLPASFTEPAIAATIVWVAIDNLRHETPAHRVPLALGFGFVHGFGFGSALRDLGLSSDGVIPSLLGFNLGVELGQLLVLTPIAPVLLWLRSRAPERAAAVTPGVSVVVAALGIGWMVDRALGLSFMPF